MKVTVIIPSFKRPFDLRRCLEAVARQTRPADEVLVVGRDEDSETLNVVSMFHSQMSMLRTVLSSGPGLITAMNCGLDNARGDLLVFTDDDAEPQNDWLERIEAVFADPSIGAVGGRDWLQLPDELSRFRPRSVSHVGVLTWYGALYGNHHCPLRGHAKKVMFLKGVNMAFRRHALGTHRIDTNLRGSGSQVGSEMDLCLRIRQAGFDVVFDDRILVKHYSSPRGAGDERNDLTGRMFSDICFNYQYVVAKGCTPWQALAYFCHERLLGSRPMPGLLAWIKWRFKGDRLATQRLCVGASTGCEGFRAGYRARAMERQRIANVKLDVSPANR